MRLAIKRTEEHEDRYVHILHPSGKGLLLHYRGGWDWARVQDVEFRGTPADYAAENSYMPRDGLEAEFGKLYHKASSTTPPVIFAQNDFDASETPDLKSLVEQSAADFHLANVKIISESVP